MLRVIGELLVLVLTLVARYYENKTKESDWLKKRKELARAIYAGDTDTISRLYNELRVLTEEKRVDSTGKPGGKATP